jgi:hypothetical protein
MKKRNRFKCASCGSKRNVKFYKKLGQYLCNRCGSYRVRDMEVAENILFNDEEPLKQEKY